MPAAPDKALDCCPSLTLSLLPCPQVLDCCPRLHTSSPSDLSYRNVYLHHEKCGHQDSVITEKAGKSTFSACRSEKTTTQPTSSMKARSGTYPRGGSLVVFFMLRYLPAV
ncbi:hypothetical protein PanWU01x14_135760 [Parasponia andersonii]|uniref:Uncharacterized protein n=1 Tax=Parasponia andersonii TaxID=3476 RepID=A0A2P5CPC5_PARAD|nr:hypothetical protein PanWU01x14_135760 [Parasponia andersonii]